MDIVFDIRGFKFTIILHILVSYFFNNPTNSGAVALTQATVDTTLASNELVFINFYADWCRFSNLLAPIFDEAADKIAAEFPTPGQVVMGKVDCDKENSIAARFHITKYPTLKLVRNGHLAKREYRGQRSSEAFVEFIRKQLEDPIKEFKQLNDLKNLDTKKRIIIGFFDQKDCPEYSTFRRAASNLKDDCQFHAGFGDVVRQMHPPGHPIVVFRPDVALSNERDETFNGSLLSYDETNIWMTEKCVPLVREITFENAEELTEEGLPFLILFHKPGDDETVKRFKDVCQLLATEKQTDSPPCVGIRHLQIVLLFLCLVTAYIIRVNISLAIVSMTGNATIPGIPVYDWDITTKSTLLSSFFWGYLVMNIPAAIIGHSVNNKFLLGSSFAVAGVLAILIPYAAEWGGPYAVIVIRICQGLAQGFMMPMVHGLLSQWAPPGERARQSSYILGGINFGTMVVSLLSGFLATTPWGWPSIFYMSGGLGIAWAVIWFALGGNSPATHHLISQAEREYIEKSLPHTSRDGKKMKIPWRHILTSPPVYGTTLAHWGHNWGLWTILTQVPTYFSSALGFDIKSLGFLYAMPFLCVWLIAFPLSYLADYLIRKGVTSVTVSRKIWNSIGHWGGAAGLIGIALAGSDRIIAMTLYSIVITISCCVYMGFNVNHLDLSPNFARILMGITNGTSNVTSILGPLFVGFIVNDETNVEEWRLVFYFSAASFFIGNLIFVIFGSGELQPWNDPEVKDDKNENKPHHENA